MRSLFFGILASIILTAACEDPAANKPRATTSDPGVNASNVNTGTSARPVSAKGEALPLTPENSKVEFTGSKVTGKHDGGFRQFTGTIDLVNEEPEESSVAFEIEMASVFTDADGLTDHLKTGDFFEVAKYPRSSFVSTKISPDVAKGPDHYAVTGDLELRGTKRSITFPARITVNDSEVEVKAEFSIDRKEFGIVYAGKADDLIRDDVVIRLDLGSPRKK